MTGAAGAGRQRADALLVALGLAPNRTKAQALVLAGRVRAAGQRIDKPGRLLPAGTALEVDPGPRWVGRGGGKLDPVLGELGVDPRGLRVLDVGASTGGFTQVLLAHGAAEVVALDVGRAQLDWTLRQDPRVRVLDGCNARYLRPEALPFAPSLAVIDVSFISLELVLPAVLACLAPGGDVVALVKPQFEVGRAEVGRGGIVRDPALHRKVILHLAAFVRRHGGAVLAMARSPLLGAEGNAEFFMRVAPGPGGLGEDAIASAAERLTAAAEAEP